MTPYVKSWLDEAASANLAEANSEPAANRHILIMMACQQKTYTKFLGNRRTKPVFVFT
jgi:hypothetical protein